MNVALAWSIFNFLTSRLGLYLLGGIGLVAVAAVGYNAIKSAGASEFEAYYIGQELANQREHNDRTVESMRELMELNKESEKGRAEDDAKIDALEKALDDAERKRRLETRGLAAKNNELAAELDMERARPEGPMECPADCVLALDLDDIGVYE